MVRNNLRKFEELERGWLRLAQKKVEIWKKLVQNAEFFYHPEISLPWCMELLLKDEWDDDMKIIDLDWNQYDWFCRKYQKDKVATIPAPAAPIAYKQPMDPIARWDNGIRQDPGNFPTLKEMKQWDKWKHIWMAMATAQLAGGNGAPFQL